MNRQDWHTLTGEALERNLDSDLEHGLTRRAAEDRLAAVGPNELPEAPPPSPLSILLTQFSSVIIWVLFGAALVSGLLQKWIDAAAIVAIVLLAMTHHIGDGLRCSVEQFLFRLDRPCKRRNGICLGEKIFWGLRCLSRLHAGAILTSTQCSGHGLKQRGGLSLPM